MDLFTPVEKSGPRYCTASQTVALRDDWWVVGAGRSMLVILSHIRLSRNFIGSVPGEAGVAL